MVSTFCPVEHTLTSLNLPLTALPRHMAHMLNCVSIFKFAPLQPSKYLADVLMIFRKNALWTQRYDEVSCNSVSSFAHVVLTCFMLVADLLKALHESLVQN